MNKVFRNVHIERDPDNSNRAWLIKAHHGDFNIDHHAVLVENMSECGYCTKRINGEMKLWKLIYEGDSYILANPE